MGRDYLPLTAGQSPYDSMNYVRILRNGFMHAKELENDIDAQTLTSTLHNDVNESACRSYLTELRSTASYVFSHLPTEISPIVIRENVNWMGTLEVP